MPEVIRREMVENRPGLAAEAGAVAFYYRAIEFIVSHARRGFVIHGRTNGFGSVLVNRSVLRE